MNKARKTENTDLRINGERLWSRLMEMAQIGATAKGGCNRQALTDLDQEGRNLFLKWCEEAGCTHRIDAIGNLFVRKAGRDDSLAPVVSGSHLDTQPTGGKFDGVFGVLAALEVIQTLHENDIVTKHPLEIVVWTNEEGARFSPAMMGSGVYAGVFDFEGTLAIQDKAGVSVREALQSIGVDTSKPFRRDPIHAAFEAHIEQGPILEIEDLPIGVVTGIQGIRWYDLVLTGQPVHAGPTPMDVRCDPVRGASKIINKIYEMVQTHGKWARATFGDLNAQPGSRNTVPEQVTVAVDLRHPDQSTLETMDAEFRSIVKNLASEYGLKADILDEWNLPAVSFDPNCIEAVQKSVSMLGYPHMQMVSGAGHDAGYLAKIAPTSMIFVPCEDGISHNEAENAHPDDLEKGCNVLLHAVLESALTA